MTFKSDETEGSKETPNHDKKQLLQRMKKFPPGSGIVSFVTRVLSANCHHQRKVDSGRKTQAGRNFLLCDEALSHNRMTSFHFPVSPLLYILYPFFSTLSMHAKMNAYAPLPQLGFAPFLCIARLLAHTSGLTVNSSSMNKEREIGRPPHGTSFCLFLTIRIALTDASPILPILLSLSFSFPPLFTIVHSNS
ncbi:hypothetical protein ACTXT7_012739 [Hymenolepis weldensis]